MTWERELREAREAVREAAACLERDYAADAGVRSASGKDVKTRADVAAEEIIVRRLQATGVPVLAEESAGAESKSEGPRWLVDPLDGTMNFTRGYPSYAVSVGLWDGMRPVLGVIQDLPHRSLYTGIVGVGAWRDDVPIRVSGVQDRRQAILATGFPVARDYGDAALTAFIGRVQGFKKIRMIGSAALSLAMVASGVFEVYFEEDIMLWDVAAGGALVAAAGGVFTARPGSRPHAVVACGSNGGFAID